MEHTFEELLVKQCAPTLAGIKAGSLFCFGTPEQARHQVCQWHARLAPLGLAVTVLLERRSPQRSIVYVYRPRELERLLASDECRAFLARCGYRTAGVEGMLHQLSQRLRIEREFPHEIGIFLGYPLQDVVGFIENRGQNFTCCGLWKAYGDPIAAQKCFDCCKKCIDCYTQMFGSGVPIEKMALPA